jgi:hypothetical protein
MQVLLLPSCYIISRVLVMSMGLSQHSTGFCSVILPMPAKAQQQNSGSSSSDWTALPQLHTAVGSHGLGSAHCVAAVCPKQVSHPELILSQRGVLASQNATTESAVTYAPAGLNQLSSQCCNSLENAAICAPATNPSGPSAIPITSGSPAAIALLPADAFCTLDLPSPARASVICASNCAYVWPGPYFSIAWMKVYVAAPV